jgi:hypothetical protein
MASELTYTILEQCDCNIIAVLDTSKYEGDITNPVLRVFPPDLNQYVNLQYNQSATTLIRPELIKFSSLPSGIYKFVQSICPNEDTEVESCYLQVCKEREDIKKLICDDKDIEELTELLYILDIAQGVVSECPNKATELLNIVRQGIIKLKTC